MLFLVFLLFYIDARRKLPREFAPHGAGNKNKFKMRSLSLMNRQKLHGVRNIPQVGSPRESREGITQKRYEHIKFHLTRYAVKFLCVFKKFTEKPV